MPQSVMKHQFSQVPRADIPRSSFDRSHGYKTTFNAGYIVPIYIDEALPGDTFNLHLNAFARLATPLHPFMDNLFMDFFFFAVPNRLVWDNWNKFMGEQDNPDDPTDYLVPVMTSPGGGYAVGSLSDYFGIRTGIAGIEHDSWWHRGYNLIYKEWFRDQNLQASPVIDKGDGPDTPANYVLRRRGKRHDYFTSALPWPQKGDAVEIPLGGTIPITGTLTSTALTGTALGGDSLAHVIRVTGSGQPQNLGPLTIAGGAPNDLLTSVNVSSAGNIRLSLPVTGTVTNNAVTGTGNLSAATAIGINTLRQGFQIQKILERDARGGTRYTEIIHAHFGVTSPDARLQRPEYLGGGSVPINVSPIAQTSSTDTEPTPQGNLAGIGTAHARGIGFTKSFTEHTLLFGFVSVRADLNYQQGLNRMFSRQTRYDFYWPALSHIGEQAVLNKEIFTQATAADEEVFGYQERYAEYRYKPSQITGQFRSDAASSLDTWHLAQDFASLPVLNDEFIEDNPPVERVIAVPTEPHIIYDSYIQLRCARPMPVYSVPSLIDHF